MRYALVRHDGSVAITSLLPTAVIIDGISHRATQTVQRAIYLEGPKAGGLLSPVDINDLEPDSVDGVILEFPTIEGVLAKWPPDQRAEIASWHPVNVADIPIDRTFRDAWASDGKVVGHDMGKARAIHRDRMRAARALKLSALDVAYQRADETSDAAAKRDIANRKQVLRDVTAHPAIDAAKTVDELKAAWPDVLK